MAVPTLDLIMLPTYSLTTIAVGDSSVYPTGWNASTPTIQITPPGYGVMTHAFVAGGVQVYNAITLGILMTDDITCQVGPLPDGIYTFKYSIAPALTYNVTKQFLRTDQLESDKDAAFLKLEMMECDGKLKRQNKLILDDIEFYISGAQAAANKCALKQSVELYNKARKLLNEFVNNTNCNCR